MGKYPTPKLLYSLYAERIQYALYVVKILHVKYVMNTENILMTKEDRIQVALGLKFKCSICGDIFSYMPPTYDWRARKHKGPRCLVCRVYPKRWLK